MVEVLGALVIWFGIAIGLAWYRRYYLQESRGDAEFEAWCATQPRLVYVACRPGGYHHVRRELLEHISEAAPIVATEGSFPWPLYALELDVERVAPDVLAVTVVGCKQRRGRNDRYDEPLRLIESVVKARRDMVEEVWLHGQLHLRSHKSKLDRARVGWLGRVENDRLVLEPMVGTPAWAQPASRAA